VKLIIDLAEQLSYTFCCSLTGGPMNIESISGMDSCQESNWNDKQDVAIWNGRSLNTVHANQPECRISAIALQRAQFNNAQTGFVLCKNERSSEPSSSNKQSENNSSNSNTKNSNEEPKETEIRQKVSVGGESSKDNGRSSNNLHGKYVATFEFPNGTSLEVTAKAEYERRNDYGESGGRSSGEIDASFNF